MYGAEHARDRPQRLSPQQFRRVRNMSIGNDKRGLTVRLQPPQEKKLPTSTFEKSKDMLIAGQGLKRIQYHKN
jgi:hypothetical protein